jgi:hypothetical protein
MYQILRLGQPNPYETLCTAYSYSDGELNVLFAGALARPPATSWPHHVSTERHTVSLARNCTYRLCHLQAVQWRHFQPAVWLPIALTCRICHHTRYRDTYGQRTIIISSPILPYSSPHYTGLIITTLTQHRRTHLCIQAPHRHYSLCSP